MGGYISLSYSTTSNGNSSATVRVTMSFYGNGVSYNSDNCTCSVTLNGTTKYFYHSFTSSTSAQVMGYADFTISKTHSTQSLTASGSMVTGVSLGTLTATKAVSVSAKTSYSVSFKANGGSNAPSTQTKWYGERLTLSSKKPTRTGYTFKGWGTSASTTTVAYNAGGSYTANSAITLYAIWQAKTFTVSYNANGGSGAPSSQTKTYGVKLTLSSTKPTRSGYSFSGWATSATGSVAYQSGGTYTANKAVTLYAVWTQTTYSVTYNANGGTGAPASQTKVYGANLTLQAGIPTRAGFIFTGWATSATGEVKYQPADVYKENKALNLYAVWVDAYIPPKIKAVTTERCSVDGSVNIGGDYVKMTVEWESAKNADGTTDPTDIAFTGAYSYSESSTEASGTASAIVYIALGDTDEAVITITDPVTQEKAEQTVELPAGAPAVHFNRTGTAVSFFGIADDEDSGVFINGDGFFNGRAFPKYKYITADYSTQTARAWEYTGLEVEVPAGHIYLTLAVAGWTHGRPTGIGFHTSTSLDTWNAPNQRSESLSNDAGLSRAVFMLSEGVYYLYNIRQASGSNTYNVYIIDFDIA